VGAGRCHNRNFRAAIDAVHLTNLVSLVDVVVLDNAQPVGPEVAYAKSAGNVYGVSDGAAQLISAKRSGGGERADVLATK
jgi:hypothetical protein